MLGIIATAALGLAAIGDGGEPEEDEDLLTLLGEGLTMEIDENQFTQEWTVFIYAGGKQLDYSFGSERDLAIFEAIPRAFQASAAWPLIELRELAVNTMLKEGYAESREQAYKLLDKAQERAHRNYVFLEDDDWYTDRKYA